MTAAKKKISPYGSTKFTSIDEYHVSFPKNTQKILQQLRQTIKQVAPQATETISYNIPAFKNIVSYAGYKEHIGFYPGAKALTVFKDELTKFNTAKGTIQFPIDKPLPTALIKKIVKFRVAEDLQKVKTKKAMAKNFIHYHKDGSVWAKGKMMSDQMHGYWEWFRKDGIIMRSGYFDNGKQVGEWTTYDKQGKVYKVTKMKVTK
jgi:uncharacterized protein YdhG (YjbR/CyaY superfamily)